MGEIFALAFLFASLKTHALEIYRNPEGDQTVVYQAQGHWVVDKFTQGSDGWPEASSHGEFKDPKAIEKPNSPPEVMLPMSHKELLGRDYFLGAGGIWPVTQKWDAKWEEAFSKWVEENLTPDFFVKAGFATACSDVEYALRWIFARNNGLPAANRLMTGEWFTSRSLRDSWRRLPTAPEWYKDRRFMAALTYLTHHTFTHTLWNDSYPIALEKGVLVPGAFHVNRDSTSGHTMIVTKVSEDPNEVPVETLSSTTPRAIRDLNLFMYSEKKADPEHLGVMKMRWPSFENGHVELVENSAMPGFSLEQFQPDFIHTPRVYFWEEIFFRISPNLNPDAIAVAMRDQIRQMFIVRQPLVENGFAACQRPHRCVENGYGWEDWSTVSRDQRLGNDIEVFDKFLARSQNPGAITAGFDQPLLKVNGEQLTFSRLLDTFRKRTYSSDPSDSLAKRWGLVPVPIRNM